MVIYTHTINTYIESSGGGGCLLELVEHVCLTILDGEVGLLQEEFYNLYFTGLVLVCIENV